MLHPFILIKNENFSVKNSAVVPEQHQLCAKAYSACHKEQTGVKLNLNHRPAAKKRAYEMMKVRLVSFYKTNLYSLCC